MSIVSPIFRPLTRRVIVDINRAALPAWNPRNLFAAGEQGAWYDPSDLSTLYQDIAGTLPVVSAGNPAGRVLDASRTLGAELWNTVTPPNVNAPWTANGDGSFTSNGSVVGSCGWTNGKLTPGRTYIATCTVNRTAGSVILPYDGVGNSNSVPVSASGTYTHIFVAVTGNLFIYAPLGFLGTVSNITVREITGNHATQATSTARPLYQSTPSRLVYDGVDDSLVTTFLSSLGSSCTVARSIPGTGAQILTGQTVGTSYTDTTSHCGLVIINRALTAGETTALTTWLNQQAGL